MNQPAHNFQPQADRLLRITDVSDATSLAPSTIYKYLKMNRFPRPIKGMPGGATRWTQSSINAWVQERLEEANS